MGSVNFSLLIPCYNEGPTFEKSVREIFAELKKLKLNWELIFIEDKSTDKTKHSVEKIIASNKNSRAIYHSTNQGRGKAVSDGILASKGDICGYLDVDLEVSATYIPIFIKEIRNGSDLVVGKRFYDKSFNSIIRVLASKFYSLAIKWTLALPIDDTEAGYKFFNRKKILPVLPKIKSPHWFWDTEICARSFWTGLKISQVPVIFKRREDKQSTVRILPDTLDYVKNLLRLRRERHD